MVVKTPDYEKRLTEYETGMADLQSQLKAMEEEVVTLRRRLQDAPKRVRTLEERLLDTKGQLAQAVSQNEKLTYTLREAREHIAALREEVDKLTQPPSAYGTLLGLNDDGSADVFSSGRKMRVETHPAIEEEVLVRGAEVVLNESLNIVKVRDPEKSGEVVSVKEMFSDGLRAFIVGRADEERVVELAEHLVGTGVRAGDSMLLDVRSSVLVEKLPKAEVEDLVLEEVPDVSYDDIGGLNEQIETIVDAVELPFLHADLFAEHQLPAPKGILLYGPPGCGKTLIAKAVANSLAKKVSELSGDTEAKSFFLNIKGPELLNKYVGETERQIRLIFQRAREKSEEGMPVIIFFDEMESLFRTRGSGISSDIESTIVPQLLAEIDGVETLKDLPIHETEIRNHVELESALLAMIDQAVDFMYRTDDETRFLEVTYQNGDKEILYFKDFSSGAMIENIVRRAKKLAIKRFLDNGEKGIMTEDLLVSVTQEYKEQEDLPNTTNPDDWAKISGKKGERIVYVRTLVGPAGAEKGGGRTIEQVATGQYL